MPPTSAVASGRRDRRCAARLGAGRGRRPHGRGRRRRPRQRRAQRGRGRLGGRRPRGGPVPLAALLLVNAPPPVQRASRRPPDRRDAHRHLSPACCSPSCRRRSHSSRRGPAPARRHEDDGGSPRPGARPMREDVLDPDRRRPPAPRGASPRARSRTAACSSQLPARRGRRPPTILLAPGPVPPRPHAAGGDAGRAHPPAGPPPGPLARGPVDLGRLPRRGGRPPRSSSMRSSTSRRPGRRLAAHPLLHRPRRRARSTSSPSWSSARSDEPAALVRAGARGRCPGGRPGTPTRCSSAR